MSYATMRDVLFALELTDSELRDRLKVEPDLPEERSELRRTRRLKAAVEIASRRVAQAKAISKISCSSTQTGINRGVPRASM